MAKGQFQGQTFRANYYYGSFMSGAQGGNLHIYEETVVFKPNELNFLDKDSKVIQIRDICGYKKGIMTWLTIYLNNGTEIKLAVWKKDEIIQTLEARRYAIYKNLGQPIPPLKVF